jgi:hypothetical protein
MKPGMPSAAKAPCLTGWKKSTPCSMSQRLAEQIKPRVEGESMKTEDKEPYFVGAMLPTTLQNQTPSEKGAASAKRPRRKRRKTPST